MTALLRTAQISVGPIGTRSSRLGLDSGGLVMASLRLIARRSTLRRLLRPDQIGRQRR